ncbi:hypothetical protein M446_6976 (plasmid) [Methylobacterium sp. 4-46]|uniref:HU family DNA-binding protein n=1 Tax=unclassified Methylobacterium TaxID=2615210 RepID=UPI000152D4E0|nr:MULTISPECIES: HU family DNA-binding protein [Methylobacterium]ACA21209.1 hypothetical protein M446_6976 [Methylobacterium sp. 4-46]WFT83778.1 integration host factor subunit beta [Methylobacterium nodulans]
MLRSQFTRRIAELNPHLRSGQANAVVRAVLDRIAEGLADGSRVELRGFGAFKTVTRDARPSRNPRTGELVTVPAKRDVKFKASVEVTKRLNPTDNRLLRVAE